MVKLDWTRASLGNPDPARVIDVGDYGAFADVKRKPTRKPVRTRSEIESIDRAEEVRAHKAALKKYGKRVAAGNTKETKKTPLPTAQPPHDLGSPPSRAPKLPAVTNHSASNVIFPWRGSDVDLVRSMWNKGNRARSIAKVIEGATKADVLRLAVFLGLSINDAPSTNKAAVGEIR